MARPGSMPQMCHGREGCNGRRAAGLPCQDCAVLPHTSCEQRSCRSFFEFASTDRIAAHWFATRTGASQDASLCRLVSPDGGLHSVDLGECSRLLRVVPDRPHEALCRGAPRSGSEPLGVPADTFVNSVDARRPVSPPPVGAVWPTEGTQIKEHRDFAAEWPGEFERVLNEPIR